MSLRVLIVDDEAPARNRLRDVLGDCKASVALEIVGEASGGAHALALLGDTEADVVLLDVRMPGMDGIETAQHLRKLARPPAIIFTTAYDQYALKAFEVHALDYLVKPIRASRLAEALALVKLPLSTAAAPSATALEAIQREQRNERSALSASERGRVHLIPVGDIIFLRAELKYVTVRTREREYLVEESLTRLEEEFGERFVRAHRSCLVARKVIRGFERGTGDNGESHWEVLLNGVSGPEGRVVISRRQQHIVREFKNA